MKKNYLLTMLIILISLSSFGQLGVTTFNTAADAGSNYSSATWLDGSNLGSGFGTWELTNSATNGGVYVGDTGQGADSFGLYSENSGNFASAERDLSSDLKMGESILVSVGHTATINGEVLLQLLDGNDVAFTLKFVGGTSNWQINDGGSDFEIGQAYAANTSLDFSFSYNEDGTYSYSFGSANGSNFNATNLISGIKSIKFQSINQGGSQNFGFNNLSIDSKYTIAGTSTVASDANITVPYLDVQTGSTLNIGTTSGVNVSGNLTANGNLNITNGSSLKVDGTSTGSNITYNVNVADTDWHLMSSPVEGEGYDLNWVNDNLIDNTTRTVGTNVGIATYVNTSDTNGDWIYVQDNAAGNFNTGEGYSIKRDATTSDISFIGTLKTDNASIAITANDIGGAEQNRWTLIGNPFASFIDVANLLALTSNGTALENSREALYVWNGTIYDPITTGHIHPGQGFFVNSNVASTLIAINQDMLAHQTEVKFYKNANSDISINLMLKDEKYTKFTEINYIADKTKGLDRKFDLGTFTGTSSSFDVFTQLIENNEGVDFMRQALPNNDLETMIIPVGVKAVANKEITFSANANNLPTDLKIFLEDRLTKTFTRLDETNSSFKVTLSENVNGIGRFYLHTKTSSVLSTDNVVLNNISIYKTNRSTLRITGLSQEKASVKLFNMLGKQVVNTSFTSNGVQDITLPTLATGIYIVQLETAQGNLNKKITLE